MGIGTLSKIYIDVSDLELSGRFWGGLLGFRASAPWQDPLGSWFLNLSDASGETKVVLQQVPEKHVVKNRVHFDVDVNNLADAVKLVVAAGGSLVRNVPSGFAVMADPDGNEFCLIPPDFPSD